MNHGPFRHLPLRAAWRTAPSAPMQDCFADEIAIDFPSVDQVVERMREAFLKDDGASDVLATELQLSSIEARRGLTVPLDVPMRRPCAVCCGRGGTWREPCDCCCGTGDSLFQHHVHVSVPAGVQNGARFRFRVSSPHAASVHVEVRVAVRTSAA